MVAGKTQNPEDSISGAYNLGVIVPGYRLPSDVINFLLNLHNHEKVNLFFLSETHVESPFLRVDTVFRKFNASRILLGLIAFIEVFRFKNLDKFARVDLINKTKDIREFFPKNRILDYSAFLTTHTSTDLKLIINFGTFSRSEEFSLRTQTDVIAVRSLANDFFGKSSNLILPALKGADSTEMDIVIFEHSKKRIHQLLAARIMTQNYFVINSALARISIIHHLDRILLNVLSSEYPLNLEDYARVNLHATNRPNIRNILQYILTKSFSKISRTIRDFISGPLLWGVHFGFKNWKSLTETDLVRIKNLPKTFLADPFLFNFGNESYCFMEKYDEIEGQGSIVVTKLSVQGNSPLIEALKEDFHLSFPFVFEYQGHIYMCPETSALGEIRLYECTDFPTKWKFAHTLIPNLSAADSMIFEYDDQWWLFTNVDSTNIGDHSSELHIFYADTPLSKDWTSHPANPIYVDSLRGRNAGLIKEANLVFRVNQIQGMNSYGRSFSVNEIMHLSKTAYAEKRVEFDIDALGLGKHGSHHLSSLGALTAIDNIQRG